MAIDIRNFVLSYYGKDTHGFHIKEIREPKAALSLHTHEYFQIYYVTSGKIIHHLESSEAEMSRGDVFLIPPGLAHYIETSGEALHFYSLSFESDFLQEITGANLLVKDLIQYIEGASWDKILPSVMLSEEDVIFAETIVTRMMREYTASTHGSESIIKAALGLLLSIFARAYFNQTPHSPRLRPDRESIMHCMRYIENHLGEDITLDEIARNAAMSRTAFCAAFRRVAGEPFKKYLNRKRVENAARLIKSGEKITAAATLSGFRTYSTFSRSFKSHIGVTASEYHNVVTD